MKKNILIPLALSLAFVGILPMRAARQNVSISAVVTELSGEGWGGSISLGSELSLNFSFDVDAAAPYITDPTWRGFVDFSTAPFVLSVGGYTISTNEMGVFFGNDDITHGDGYHFYPNNFVSDVPLFYTNVLGWLLSSDFSLIEGSQTSFHQYSTIDFDTKYIEISGYRTSVIENQQLLRATISEYQVIPEPAVFPAVSGFAALGFYLMKRKKKGA